MVVEVFSCIRCRLSPGDPSLYVLMNRLGGGSARFFSDKGSVTGQIGARSFIRLERFLGNISKDVEGLRNTEMIVAKQKLVAYEMRGLERNVGNVIRKLGAAEALMSTVFWNRL